MTTHSFILLNPHLVEPITLAEARRILSALDFPLSFDPTTRMMAFRVAHAALKGQPCPVLVMVAGPPVPTTEPPKDAA